MEQFFHTKHGVQLRIAPRPWTGTLDGVWFKVDKALQTDLLNVIREICKDQPKSASQICFKFSAEAGQMGIGKRQDPTRPQIAKEAPQDFWARTCMDTEQVTSAAPDTQRRLTKREAVLLQVPAEREHAAHGGEAEAAQDTSGANFS